MYEKNARTSTIQTTYTEKEGFVEFVVCPICHKTIKGNPELMEPYSDHHLVRRGHGCGGYVGIFMADEDQVQVNDTVSFPDCR